MIQTSRNISWSMLRRLKVSLKWSRNISAESKKITELYGGHIPVMVKEIVDILDPKDTNLYVDMTFGAGGHTKSILQKAPNARVICLDQDPTAHRNAICLSELYEPGQVTPCLGKFSDIPDIFKDLNVEPGSVDGFLFDLGASSMQFDTASRGFSLSQDGPLDMRMDQGRENQISAMDVVNNLDQHDLFDIIRKYGEEKNARKIAQVLVESRYAFGKITRTKQLAEIVESIFEEKFNKDKLHRRAHVATRTFQALRIFVNNELNELSNGLVAAHHLLKSGGKCLVVSFHSLEDRIVKRHFHGINLEENISMPAKDFKFRMRNNIVSYEQATIDKLLYDTKWKRLLKRIVEPTEDECTENPRVRSAKLRAAIKS